MKRLAIAICVVVLVFAVASIAQTLAQPKSMSVEQQLIRFEQDWTNALVKTDLVFLDRLLADDYTETDAEGTVRAKGQFLGVFKSGEVVLSSMVADDMKVRIYGNAAVVTGRNTFKGTSKGKNINGQERWTDTWIKEAGRWQCVATHVSNIVQK